MLGAGVTLIITEANESTTTPAPRPAITRSRDTAIA
jgi:hypothetical protein